LQWRGIGARRDLRWLATGVATEPVGEAIAERRALLAVARGVGGVVAERIEPLPRLLPRDLILAVEAILEVPALRRVRVATLQNFSEASLAWRSAPRMSSAWTVTVERCAPTAGKCSRTRLSPRSSSKHCCRANPGTRHHARPNPSYGMNNISAGGANDYIKAHFGRGSIDCGGGEDILYISRRAQRDYKIHNCERISHETLGY
jgi:hypothetical protein